MRNLAGLLGAAAFVSLAAIGCVKDPTSLDQATAKGSGSVKMSFVASANSEFSTLADSAEIVISGYCGDTVRQALQVTSSGVSGTVNNLPACSWTKFEVIVYESTGQICYYGYGYSDVYANQTTYLNITLYRGNGTGSAEITGTIIDSITSSCFIIDSTQISPNMAVITWICHGDTIRDTIWSGPIDTCYDIGSTFINGTIYSVRVCGGDTIYTRIDTIPDTSACVYDTIVEWDTLFARTICNGDTFIQSLGPLNPGPEMLPYFYLGYSLYLWSTDSNDVTFALVDDANRTPTRAVILRAPATVSDTGVVIRGGGTWSVESVLRLIPGGSTLKITNGPVNLTQIRRAPFNAIKAYAQSVGLAVI